MENSYARHRTFTDKAISAFNKIRYAFTEPGKLQLARLRWESAYQDELNKNPLITLMMPTFKRGQLLVERTLPSILSQTYQNFEVVIVGDNRLDNTAELVANLKDPRIKFYHLPEYTKYPKDPKLKWFSGGAPPRNYGLKLARGLWIAELDDDDIFTPDHIESLLRFAQNNNYEFVSAIYEAERYGKRILVDVKDERPRIGGIGTWLYRSYLRLFRYNVNCWRKAYNCPQEIDRQWRMHNTGVRIGFLDKVVTIILPLPGSQTVGLDALEIRTGRKLR